MPLVCLFGAALWNSCTLLEIYGHSVPMYIDPFEFSRPSSVGCCAVFICCLIKTPMFGEKNIHYFCIMFPRYDDHLQHTFQYVSLYIIIAYLIAYHISNWLNASMPDFFCSCYNVNYTKLWCNTKLEHSNLNWYFTFFFQLSLGRKDPGYIRMNVHDPQNMKDDVCFIPFRLIMLIFITIHGSLACRKIVF